MFHPTVGGRDPAGEDLYGDHGPVGLRWRAPLGRRSWGGFHSHGDSPQNRWMVDEQIYFHGKMGLKEIIFGGTTISENLKKISEDGVVQYTIVYWYTQYGHLNGHFQKWHDEKPTTKTLDLGPGFLESCFQTNPCEEVICGVNSCTNRLQLPIPRTQPIHSSQLFDYRSRLALW